MELLENTKQPKILTRILPKNGKFKLFLYQLDLFNKKKNMTKCLSCKSPNRDISIIKNC